MPQSEPITILLVNEDAEEIKLVTISLRSFLSEIRIEVAYSAEEADRMMQSVAGACAVVLIDEGSLPDPPSAYISELKRRAAYASIVLQTSRTDSRAALDALHMGADLFLYKHSPAFLTEVVFCTKEAIDRREKRLAAEGARARYEWLMETSGDLLYELDADGRFLSLSAGWPKTLGYRPEELIGLPYTTLFSDADQRLVRFRFNERRAGERATKQFALRLKGKLTPNGTALIQAAISARGLYDASRRFLGTLGLIRGLPDWSKPQPAEEELAQQRQRAEELERIVRQINQLSQGLEQPLATLLHQSRHLSETLREARIVDQLQSLTSQAAASAEVAQRLVHLARPGGAAHIINRLLEDVLEDSERGGFTRDLGSALPDYAGDPAATARVFRHLLAYAAAYLTTVGRPHILALKTSAGGLADASDAPTLFPLTPPAHIQVDITETDAPIPSGFPASLTDSLDVPGLYRSARELGATLDISAPASGAFRMTVRLPTGVSRAVVPVQPEVSETPAGRTSEPPAPVRSPAAPETVGVARADRRRHTRVETALPAKVTKESSSWQGTVVNLSVGGAGLRMPAEFPVVPAPKEAVILVTTAVATLELTGFVQTRIPSLADTHRAVAPGSELIVEFHQPTQTETAVLASLIVAARERSLSLTLDIRLPASGITQTDRPVSLDFAEHDRRQTLRLATALPARLETPLRQEPTTRLPAQVINLSRSGACLFVRERPDLLVGSVQIHFAPPHRSEPGSHEPGPPDAVLAGTIVWATADSSAPSALHASDHASAARAGLRFEPLSPYAERELNRVIRQHMRAQRAGETSATGAVVSVPRECRNARGQAIAISDDHLGLLADPNRPVIVMVPGYGQTAADYMALAYYLAQYQFRILRYDPTNHLGNSEGELQQTTLRSMQHDLEQIIEFVRHTWPQAPVVVVASDLAGRAALKTGAHTRPLDLLILVNPTIDVAGMLMAVHGHDLIADYQFGLRRGVCNLLGLNVNVDQFVGDLVAGRFADLESTLEDLRLIRSPLCIATSPADSTTLPPVDLPHAFMTALGTHTRLVNISSSLTDRVLDVQGAPPAAFKQLLKQIGAVLSVQSISPQEETAAQPFVARQRRMEDEYTFLRHDGSQINREALCAAHIAQLPHLGNLHEYRKLLDDLYSLMSPLEPGAVLVDAGVGQSDLTRAALVNHTYRAGLASWSGRPSPLMVGVGRSRERIVHARHAVMVLQRELATGFVGRLSAMPPLSIGWLQADWTHALPFTTGSLSRLVCNLSLPYVPSPLAALKEWHRTLHPDGSLILTTFHPNTDLSPLYRRHLRQANQDEFSAQAQPLLHYFARLREAIRHRILHTFDEAGLAALLQHSGIGSFRILPIFDGQALAAIVGKQNSSSPLR